MASLFDACLDIQGNGIFDYTIGNNDISIEAFDSLESYRNTGDSDSQDNIVLIKSQNITIESGEFLTLVNPKKSLVLFCDTLSNNGTISMTGKGPNTLPHDYYILENNDIFDEDVIIPAYANNRVERTHNEEYVASGISGNNGINRQCGSGGQGSATASNSGSDPYRGKYKALGASGSGYAFGGGAGAGGKSGNSSLTYESDADVDIEYPMLGAPGRAYSYYAGSGGVGVISGTGEYKTYYNYDGQNGAPQDQNTGVGGRIIIFCNTLINNGTIEANGISAYSSNMYGGASGGSSGGGAVDVFYYDSFLEGTINANGGESGDILGYIYLATPDEGGITRYDAPGGKGGDGCVTISQLNFEIMDYTDKIQEFNYTGKTQVVTLEPGVYEFYCRGAQGGGDQGLPGDSAKARITIKEQTDFYINVGQKALDNLGGWNGGGSALENAFGSGGSTDIAVHGLFQDTNWNTELHLNSRIITAIGGNGEPSSSLLQDINGTTNISYSYVVHVFTADTACNLNFRGSGSQCVGSIFNDTTGVCLATNDNSSGIFNLSISVEKDKTYRLELRGYKNRLSTCNWSITFSNIEITQGGISNELSYVYTQDTKDSYPTNPCNAGTYYMVKPIITRIAPEAVGDGFAYIKKIGETVKKPSLSGIYTYNKNPQTAVLNDFDSLKFSVSGNVRTNAGTTNIVVSIIDNKYYWEDGENTNINIPWLIAKADPEVIWPTPSPLIVDWPISKSKLLNGIGTGTFAWSTPTLKMTWPNTGYEVKFTPTDTTNYNIIKKYIIIKLISERYNSNFYKDSIPQEHFDFSKLLNSLLK